MTELYFFCPGLRMQGYKIGFGGGTHAGIYVVHSILAFHRLAIDGTTVYKEIKTALFIPVPFCNRLYNQSSPATIFSPLPNW